VRSTGVRAGVSGHDLRSLPRVGPACAPGGPPKAEPGALAPGQRRREAPP